MIEIKCPKTKRNSSPLDLINDKNFYVYKDDDGMLRLKKNHPFGYYTQVQMAMGLSTVKFCDLVVYTFKGLLVVRTDFDEEYFNDLVKKFNRFYRDYMLPKLC